MSVKIIPVFGNLIWLTVKITQGVLCNARFFWTNLQCCFVRVFTDRLVVLVWIFPQVKKTLCTPLDVSVRGLRWSFTYVTMIYIFVVGLKIVLVLRRCVHPLIYGRALFSRLDGRVEVAVLGRYWVLSTININR